MNIQAMMKQAQKMQTDIEKNKTKLAQKEFIVEKQGVTLTMMGNKKVKSININEALIDPEEKEIVEDLMIIAFNDAINLIEQEEEKFSPQTLADIRL